MPDTIWNFLMQRYPAIAIALFVLLLVIVATWKFCAFYSKTQNTMKEIPDIKKMLQNIHTGLLSLNSILIEKSVIGQSCYSSANSPRALNDVGKRLLEQSGADKLLEDKKEVLISELEKQKVDTLLRLEQLSLQVLIYKMNRPEFKALQDFAFQNPAFDGNPLSYIDILYVMSLALRDEYRNKHPELI